MQRNNLLGGADGHVSWHASLLDTQSDWPMPSEHALRRRLDYAREDCNRELAEPWQPLITCPYLNTGNQPCQVMLPGASTLCVSRPRVVSPTIPEAETDCCHSNGALNSVRLSFRARGHIVSNYFSVEIGTERADEGFWVTYRLAQSMARPAVSIQVDGKTAMCPQSV